MFDDLKKLFSSKEREWEKRGKSHKLGSAPPPAPKGTAPQQGGQAPSSSRASAGSQQAAPSPHTSAARQPPQSVSSHSSAAQGSRPVQSHQDRGYSQGIPPSSAPARHDPRHQVSEPTETDENLQMCLALVVSQQGEGVAAHALSLLNRIVHNILSDPQAEKFRQVRLSSPAIKQALGVPGFLDFLQGTGFVLCSKLEEGGFELPVVQEAQLCSEHASFIASSDRHYAVLPASAPLKILSVGAQELRRAMQGMQEARHEAGSGSSRAASSGSLQQQQQSAVDRDTQVILPCSPDMDIPDSFFERTAAEIKSEWLRLTRERSQNEVLTTRKMREQREAAAGPAKKIDRAVLRVRFPEGVVLQGQFGLREPLTAVHTWLSSTLRNPAICYELALPTRKQLPVTGLIQDVPDILPSAVLNFKIAGGQPHQYAKMPCLSDAMLRLTRTE